MSTLTSSPISHPPYGGQGQARPPKFQEHDLVHILSAPNPSNASSTSDSSKTTPTPTKPKATTNPFRPPQPLPLSEHIPRTVWKIASMSPSASSDIEHIYHLQPFSEVHITIPESRLLLAQFLPGEIIKKNKLLYKVQEVRFAKNEAGKVVLRYAVVDEVGEKTVIDHGEDVFAGDAVDWFPMTE